MTKEQFAKEVDEIVAYVKKDRRVRVELCRQSHLFFFLTYIRKPKYYDLAAFQREIIRNSEDDKLMYHVVMAFRNSAKSTILTYSFPIWAILGRQQCKFILIVSQTRTQARLHLSSIKRTLEDSSLLRQDLGPFEMQEDEWGAYAHPSEIRSQNHGRIR